jgi:flagellin-like hook-associated protein FlgL
MPSISSIPTTRVSDLLIRQRLLAQMGADQTDMVRLQTQISTGHRFALPSEDAPAALRVMSLQKLLEQKSQVQVNLKTNQSYLSASDAALAAVSDILASARGTALGVVGTTSTDVQRSAVIEEVDQAIQQLVNTGNQQFRGRYLFAGSRTTVRPFEETAEGNVKFNGNEGKLLSYSDTDLLFESNMDGNQVFGAVSEPVRGTADLNPILTAGTHVADLRGGLGISKGSIAVSDGTNTSIVDISSAETLGDVAALIEAHPPQGRTVTVSIASTGLEISLDAGNLTVKEVGGGTTVGELGILKEIGAGPGPVVGTDLNPRLTLTTPLADILGVRAGVTLGGANNGVVIEAARRGPAMNGVTVSFANTCVGPGTETVQYDPAAKTLVFNIHAPTTTAKRIVEVLGADPVAGDLFTAALYQREGVPNDGSGLVATSATGVTAGGSGIEFDQNSGLRIVNGGQEHLISFTAAETVQDMLNILNGSTAGVLADINQAGTGIDIRSRVSGSDFAIGENGGSTATELGLRTFTAQTRLEDLNFGLGVHAVGKPDFTIRRSDTVKFDVDVSSADTIGDVLNLINNNPDNLSTLRPVVARLNAFGNGIELLNTDPAPGEQLSVERANLSQAGMDLGLIPKNAEASGPSTVAAAASATVTMAGANNDLVFTSKQPGTGANGIAISFFDTGLGAGSETVVYNPATGTLAFGIDPATTTAAGIIAHLTAEPAANAAFAASLVSTDGAPNNGGGLVQVTAAATMSGGTAQTLSGRDVRPEEVEGTFSALIRLRTALANNDTLEIERAISLVDASAIHLNFARAELGARQQGLDILRDRLGTEDIDLKNALSEEYDVDMAKAVSDMTLRQTSYEASLRTTAQLFQLTLLNFL